MAVTFDNASTAVGASVSTLQWTHTSVADANPYLAVGLLTANAFAVSAMAYNGVAVNLKMGVLDINRAEIRSLVGINTGALTVSANLTGTDVAFGCIACSYIGVSQATPESGNSQSGTSTATNQNLSLSSTAGGIAISICATDGFGTNNYTDPATQTRRGYVNTRPLITFSEKATSNTTTSFSWSATAALDNHAMGYYLSATAVAAGSAVFTLAQMNVGK